MYKPLLVTLLLIFLSVNFSFGEEFEVAQFRKDLVYVVDVVSNVHPALADVETREEFKKYAMTLTDSISENTPSWQVGIMLGKLLRWIDDAHTTTDITYGSESYLPLEFAWLSDGLIVAPVKDVGLSIPAFSRVLKVGSYSIEALEAKLSTLVPENKYWVRATGARVLRSEGVLRWLNVLQDKHVQIVVETPEGEIEEWEIKLVGEALMTDESGLATPLEIALKRARGLDGPWRSLSDSVAWRVESKSDYGFLWLVRCVNSDDFQSEVEQFFQEVVGAEVQNVVLSVQQNSGGESAVIDTVLSYLNIDEYRTYSTTIQRYSQEVHKHTGLTKQQFGQEAKYRQESLAYNNFDDEVVNHAHPIFKGNVFIIVDSASFSAASDLATVLYDHDLATLVGEPSGGAPTGFGNSLQFVTPNLKIPFSVSWMHYTRAEPQYDPANTLFPDISLAVTVKDIQAQKSPINRWLAQLHTLPNPPRDEY